ncbi:MAG: TPM domain-containing protein [Flavobacteriaceae bacterium]|nr:TPM domain-containing protein [Flavobacteriaceae bacterium]
MSHVEDFLSAKQEQELIESIRLAEKNTSGEIRVHLERTTHKEPLERAVEVFHFLKMDETEQRNGVLFYVAVDDKKFSVVGDKGINQVVPDDFWNSVKDLVIGEFKKAHYTNGLKLGILEAGNKLKQYFPYKIDDINEIDDSISIG